MIDPLFGNIDEMGSNQTARVNNYINNMNNINSNNMDLSLDLALAYSSGRALTAMKDEEDLRFMNELKTKLDEDTQRLMKWDKRFLSLARFVSSWSKDPSTQVGAVIVDSKFRIVSLGFNGFPRGSGDCKEKLENRDLKYKMTLHAECNAILFANKSLEGCTIYSWPMLPCPQCAAQIIQVGIVRCVSLSLLSPNMDNETNNGLLARWGEGLALAKESFGDVGIKVCELDNLD